MKAFDSFAFVLLTFLLIAFGPAMLFKFVKCDDSETQRFKVIKYIIPKD